MKFSGFEISLGLYPGVLFGARSYEYASGEVIDHVIYIPFVDICISVYYEPIEEYMSEKFVLQAEQALSPQKEVVM